MASSRKPPLSRLFSMLSGTRLPFFQNNGALTALERHLILRPKPYVLFSNASHPLHELQLLEGRRKLGTNERCSINGHSCRSHNLLTLELGFLSHSLLSFRLAKSFGSWGTLGHCHYPVIICRTIRYGPGAAYEKTLCRNRE